MTHTLLAIALHALIAACGLGALCALGALRLRSRTLGGSAALLGLAYLCGYAVTFGAATALLTIGVPFALPTLLAITLAGTLPLIDRLRRRRPSRRDIAALVRPGSRGELVGLSVAALVFALGLATQIRVPLTQWDAWAIWTNKAALFANLSHLPADTFTAPAWVGHPDYPIGLSLWEAAHFRALGRTDTSHVAALDWGLLSAAMLAAFALAPGRSGRVSVPIIVAAALTVLPAATIGYADVPMGLFLAVGALALSRWQQSADPGALRLAVLLLGGAAITKNEGLMGAIALLLAAFACGPAAGRRAVALGAVAWAALFVAPWRIWLALNDISGDLHLGHALSPAYLADHRERLTPIFDALTTALLSDHTLMLVPIGIVALLALDRSRAVAGFFAVAAVLYLGALVLVYWISPYEIGWHLSTSADRTFRTLGLLALPAILVAADVAAARRDDDSTDTLRERS
ncbi:MAG: hypothetical protein PGN13_14835 [Patulibacter minatonensis]